MDPNQDLVNSYLARAIDEFEDNRLSTRLIRRLSEEFPGFFLIAALPYLQAKQESKALRFLAGIAIRQEAMVDYMTSPESVSRDTAAHLFRRFLEIDPSFDVKLAGRLPNRRETNLAEALDSMHSTRALDILDITSRGRRLLPIVSHLPTYRDTRISAKATLFVGRRMQSAEWTRKLLDQRDSRVRANAVESLWGLDSPAAADVFADCASDHNNRVSGNSLLGLHLLGDQQVLRRVFDLAAAGKFESRSTAAWVMGKMATKDCLKTLTQLVRDEHPQVRSTALRSLLEIRKGEGNTPRVAPAAEAKVIEEVVEVLQAVPEVREVQIRLDGSAFKVR